MDGRSFIVEITMGSLHVYFPSEAKWQKCAPDWARDQWQRIMTDLEAWCQRENIPLTIADDAWVDFSSSGSGN